MARRSTDRRKQRQRKQRERWPEPEHERAPTSDELGEAHVTTLPAPADQSEVQHGF